MSYLRKQNLLSPSAEQTLSERPLTNVAPAHTWLLGAILAAACGFTYLLLRPPLYDFDGYMYRLYGLLPSRFTNANPQHLLWNSVQIFLAEFAGAIGYPTTVPFQIFGILINCATLFLLYRLLRRASDSILVAAVGALFVGFSPSFWYLGLQNEPYPLTFLFVVLFLSAWQTAPAQAPRRTQLLAGGLYLTGAILLHQAVVTLLPGAMIALILFGQGTLQKRIGLATFWGAGVALLVTIAYLDLWHVTIVQPAETILSWSTSYVNEVHPIQLFQLGIAKTIARSVMGISGSILQDYRIQWFLAENLPPAAIYAVYDLIGLAAMIALGLLAARSGVRGRLCEFIRSNPLFTVSLLSVIAWSSFAFAWESATAHYWTLGLFPALVCIAAALRYIRGAAWALAIVTVLLSLWNCYFNHTNDLYSSGHFSEAFVRSVEEHVGQKDAFIVLSDDQWFANVNYVLLFRVLKYTDPGRGIAIFNDVVFRPGGAQSWQDKLRERINSTLDAGGRVYVAAHVFDTRSYKDLSHAGDPFNEQINPRYLELDSAAFRQRIAEFFSTYNLRKSGFSVGADNYLSVERKTTRSRASGPPFDVANSAKNNRVRVRSYKSARGSHSESTTVRYTSGGLLG